MCTVACHSLKTDKRVNSTSPELIYTCTTKHTLVVKLVKSNYYSCTSGYDLWKVRRRGRTHPIPSRGPFSSFPSPSKTEPAPFYNVFNSRGSHFADGVGPRRQIVPCCTLTTISYVLVVIVIVKNNQYFQIDAMVTNSEQWPVLFCNGRIYRKIWRLTCIFGWHNKV